MDRSFLATNAAERERLIALVRRLTDAELQRPLEGGWTVSAAIAHLAFWEQWIVVKLQRFAREGISRDGSDGDDINDALHAQWLAIPGREAARLLLEAMPAADRALEAQTDETFAAIRSAGDAINIFRHTHRAEHIEQIERALAG